MATTSAGEVFLNGSAKGWRVCIRIIGKREAIPLLLVCPLFGHELGIQYGTVTKQ
jgi:hypothetical protein